MARKVLTAIACALLATSVVPTPVFADTGYVYDSAGRLIRVTYSNGVIIDYRYDAAGNRQQITTQRLPNRAPNARNDAASVQASSVTDIAVLGNDNDPDNDPITITAVSTPTGGSAAVLSGPPRIRYTAPSSAGARTFNYTISDGQGHTSTATVTVTVLSSNQPPVAADDWTSASPGFSTTIFVTSNDTDPDNNALTVTAVGTPTGGTVAIGSGGAYVIYNAPSGTGAYSFTYTISDGAGGTSTATVYVEVETVEGCVPQPGQMCEIDPAG